MSSETNQPEQHKRIQRQSGSRNVSERAAVKPHKRVSGESSSASQQPAKPTSAAVKPTSAAPTAQAQPTQPQSVPHATTSASTPKPTSGTIDISQLLNAWAASLGNTQLGQTYAGSSLPRKEALARKQFGVPSSDQVILVLDATIFGTCKAGFALASRGIYLRDTAGKQRAIGWGDFARCKVAGDAQSLTIDGSKIVTIDGKPLASLLVSIQKAIAG